MRVGIGIYKEIDKRLDLAWSLTIAWITSKTRVSRRLDWPSLLPARSKPGFVFAKNSRAKIVQAERGPGMVAAL